ncbi:MAG: UpxY family transcription antiterminator, partial [Acidobacteriaceae bacterium]|nr:UpxY family transcription antiterminator [Acidobacteriaceae bacterium]
MTPETSLLDGTDNARGLPPYAAWYALRVRSKHEKAVGRYLDYSGFESYLPVYGQESRWSDRVKRIERVLFPGYVFVHCEPGELPEAVALSGVCGALGGLQPAVIPAAQID